MFTHKQKQLVCATQKSNAAAEADGTSRPGGRALRKKRGGGSRHADFADVPRLELQAQSKLELADVVSEVAVIGGRDLSERHGVGREGIFLADGFRSRGEHHIIEVRRGVHRGHVLVVEEVKGFAKEFESVTLVDDNTLRGAEIDDVGPRLLEVVAVDDGNAVGAARSVEGAGADYPLNRVARSDGEGGRRTADVG